MDIINNINLNILTGYKTIGVGVSGGIDSMVLLDYLVKHNFNVLAINIDHQIRGEVSASESEFVEEYCKENNINLINFKCNVLDFASENKQSVELAGRNLRQQVFRDCIANNQCDIICTAHHLFDNTETILMRILRGTSTAGLVGIKLKEGIFARPLLEVDKNDIVAYAKLNKIPYVIDESNFSMEYTRNWLRHKIIPEIKLRYANLDDAVLRLSQSAQECEEVLDGLAGQPICEGQGVVKINIAKLSKKRAIATRQILKSFTALNVKDNIETKHINLVLELARGETAKKINLPYGITAIKEYDCIAIFKEAAASEGCKHYISGASVEAVPKTNKSLPFTVKKFELGGATYSVTPTNQGEGLWFDLDKIPKTAVIRHKNNGDRFTKFGGGTKALGDYLTDIKFPVRLRDKLVLVCNGADVLIIVGLAISNKVKTDKLSSKIFTIIKEVEQ